MKRLFLAAVLAVLFAVDWFVMEYYKPVKRYQMRVRCDTGKKG